MRAPSRDTCTPRVRARQGPSPQCARTQQAQAHGAPALLKDSAPPTVQVSTTFHLFCLTRSAHYATCLASRCRCCRSNMDRIRQESEQNREIRARARPCSVAPYSREPVLSVQFCSDAPRASVQFCRASCARISSVLPRLARVHQFSLAAPRARASVQSCRASCARISSVLLRLARAHQFSFAAPRARASVQFSWRASLARISSVSAPQPTTGAAAAAVSYLFADAR